MGQPAVDLGAWRSREKSELETNTLKVFYM